MKNVIDFNIQPADEDKPHRCPNCWTIPDAARKTGKAVVGVIYVCAGCNTHWRMEKK